jgi:hypothetical protein
VAQGAFRKLNDKKNEHCVKDSSSRRSNAGGNARNAFILSGASSQSLGGAPASVVHPRRPLDCASWAECGERDRWNWTERGSSTPRVRRAIFGLFGIGDRRNEKSRFSLFALVIALLRISFPLLRHLFFFFLVGLPFRLVLAILRSSALLIDSYMPLDAPRREDFLPSPLLAANAAPAAICCFFDFAGIKSDLQTLDFLSELFLGFAESLLEPAQKFLIFPFGKRKVVVG